MFPKGDPYSEYISVQFTSLNEADFLERGVEVQISFVVKSREDKMELFKQTRKPPNVYRSESRQTQWEKFQPASFGDFKTFPGAFKKSDLEQHPEIFMPDGQLTLVCNIKLLIPETKMTSNPGMRDTGEAFPEDKSLAEDICRFSKVDLASDLSDFTLICGGRTFNCHRAILAARSEYFSAMFAHKTTSEYRENKAYIPDVSEATMEKLLEFVYSDKVTDLPPSAADLFVAADKYLLPQLREMCQDSLILNLKPDNAADVLVLAYLHEAAILKVEAMNFVRDNMTKVAETEGWKIIMKEHPKIMHEILLKEFGRSGSIKSADGLPRSRSGSVGSKSLR